MIALQLAIYIYIYIYIYSMHAARVAPPIGVAPPIFNWGADSLMVPANPANANNKGAEEVI